MWKFFFAHRYQKKNVEIFFDLKNFDVKMSKNLIFSTTAYLIK
jgi:hypothetical protein